MPVQKYCKDSLKKVASSRYKSLEDYLCQHNLTEVKGDFLSGGFFEVDT